MSTSKSGEHPIVIAYRAKLDSITEGVAAEAERLERAAQKLLADLKTPVPPENP
jgi:hypothetical protein